MALFDQQDIERRAAQFKRELEAMPNNWFLKTFLPPQETTTMSIERQLPQYQSHKKVWALKIANIIPKPNPDPTGNSVASSYGAIIQPADPGYGDFDVSADYVNKHQPQPGGYYVVYEDGYKSWSPAEAFLGGYKAIGPKGAATPDQHLEAAIVAAGANKAPRITPADIEASISSEHYFTAYGGAKYGRITRDEPKDSDALKLLTFCVLVLRNGFTVTGESACASPENFNAEIGRRIARENAVAKVWPLMGYALKNKLANQE